MTPEERDIVMATARGRGAVGAQAVLPRCVAQWAAKTDRILDFGCGHEQQHVWMLRGLGFDVTGHDFWCEGSPAGVKGLAGRFDVVMASNVLNVQPSVPALRETLGEIRGCLAPGGRAYANYPVSPRKAGLLPEEVEVLAGRVFAVVERQQVLGHHIWLCRD